MTTHIANKSLKRKLSLACLLAVLLTALWSTSGVLGVVDAGLRGRVAHQLVTDGRLVVEDNGRHNSDPMFRDKDGPYSSKFGIGQSLFFLPFDAVATGITQKLHLIASLEERIRGVLVALPVFIVVLSLNFWLCLKVCTMLRCNRVSAYALAICAVFGSTFWQMAKQAQEEVQLSILLLGAVYAFCMWQRTGRFKYVWVAAVCAASTLIFRLTGITIVIGTFALFALMPRKTIKIVLPYGIAFAPTLAILGWYNWLRTGSPLRTGYEAAIHAYRSDNLLYGLVQPMIGFDKGIYMTNPWFIPFVIATVATYQRLSRVHKAIIILCAWLGISSLAICCQYLCWAGDFTYGARYQVHLVPLLCISLGAAAIKCLRDVLKRTNRQYLFNSIVLSACTVACLLQIPSIAFNESLEIYQSLAMNGYPSKGWMTVTGLIPEGQVCTRYANFASKVVTGQAKHVELLHPEAASAEYVDQASRWNFCPFLAEGRVSPKVIKIAIFLWGALVVASLGAWAWVFNLLLYRRKAG